jgi:hypothetical protein
MDMAKSDYQLFMEAGGTDDEWDEEFFGVITDIADHAHHLVHLARILTPYLKKHEHDAANELSDVAMNTWYLLQQYWRMTNRA